MARDETRSFALSYEPAARPRLLRFIAKLRDASGAHSLMNVERKSAPACRSGCYATPSKPFPTFSEICVAALKPLRAEITAALQPLGQE